VAVRKARCLLWPSDGQIAVLDTPAVPTDGKDLGCASALGGTYRGIQSGEATEKPATSGGQLSRQYCVGTAYGATGPGRDDTPHPSSRCPSRRRHEKGTYGRLGVATVRAQDGPASASGLRGKSLARAHVQRRVGSPGRDLEHPQRNRQPCTCRAQEDGSGPLRTSALPTSTGPRGMSRRSTRGWPARQRPRSTWSGPVSQPLKTLSFGAQYAGDGRSRRSRLRSDPWFEHDDHLHNARSGRSGLDSLLHFLHTSKLLRS